MSDTLVHALAWEDRVRVISAVTTQSVRRCAEVHQTSPTATAALGRLLTAAALMGATLKGEDRISLQVLGDGPLGVLLARSLPDGRVYGTVRNPHASLPPRDDGSPDVAGAVGLPGYLMVSKDVGIGEPYVGTVGLTTGEIGDDIAAYYDQSEQVQSAVGLGVAVDADARVVAAGGFLLQVVGGLSDEDIADLALGIRSARNLSGEIAAGGSAIDTLVCLAGNRFRTLEERPIRYDAPHDRSYYGVRLAALGDLDAVFGSDPSVEIVCEFTRQAFSFTRAEIETLRDAPRD